jgi:hypothetical protein
VEPAPIGARCPRCGVEYTVYYANDERWLQRPRAEDGRVVHDCYECSIQNQRSPYLWVPLAGVIVMTFPMLWMLWSHLVAPVLILFAFLWYLGQWFRGRWMRLRGLRVDAGDERALTAPDQRTSMRT